MAVLNLIVKNFLHGESDHERAWVVGPTTYRNKSEMADGRHIVFPKMLICRKRGNCSERLYEIFEQNLIDRSRSVYMSLCRCLVAVCQLLLYEYMDIEETVNGDEHWSAKTATWLSA